MNETNDVHALYSLRNCKSDFFDFIFVFSFFKCHTVYTISDIDDMT